IINALIAYFVDTLNIEASTSNPFGTTPLRFSYLLIINISITQAINTKPTLSIKGISYTPSTGTEKPIGAKKDRSTIPGKNFKIMDIIKPPTVAKSAALEVVFFQKNPKRNIAKIPGDTKPVYSCIYWKPPFLSIPK